MASWQLGGKAEHFLGDADCIATKTQGQIFGGLGEAWGPGLTDHFPLHGKGNGNEMVGRCETVRVIEEGILTVGVA